MEELTTANPEYAKIDVDWIEESRQAELARPFAKDRYYVPSIFIDGKDGYYRTLQKNCGLQVYWTAVSAKWKMIGRLH